MNNLSDKELIEKTAWLYLDGQNIRDHKLIEQAWYPDCHMFGKNRRDEVVQLPRSFWKDLFSKPDEFPDEKRRSEILSVDIHKTVASVKVRTVIERDEGTNVYTDYLNLLKVADDEWRIVNKIFHDDFTPK